MRQACANLARRLCHVYRTGALRGVVLVGIDLDQLVLDSTYLFVGPSSLSLRPARGLVRERKSVWRARGPLRGPSGRPTAPGCPTPSGAKYRPAAARACPAPFSACATSPSGDALVVQEGPPSHLTPVPRRSLRLGIQNVETNPGNRYRSTWWSQLQGLASRARD